MASNKVFCKNSVGFSTVARDRSPRKVDRGNGLMPDPRTAQADFPPVVHSGSLFCCL
jgi:hypothetical protein